jgi:hypothetical protein
LDEAIRAAKKRAKSDDDLKRLILVNTAVGKKEDEGYRYLSDAHISVQGQDSNAAWKAVFYIAKQLGIPFEVIFTWRAKEGAAFPGVTGRFNYGARALRMTELPFDPKMLIPVLALDLSVRAMNCLKNGGVYYVGDLVHKTEAELLQIPNTGRILLNELKEVLAQMGLHLGMAVVGWPPKNLDELAKAFEQGQ